MDFHVCKSRRGSNPDAVVNCGSANGSGGLSPSPEGTPGVCRGCASPLSIQICPTTGGLFRVDIPATETIQGLRKLISKKLGVSQDRISLLHKEKLLKDGSLLENHILDGSRITLLPNVESGIMSSQPEVSVMQALENLSDGQVNDFLSGKSPLTLAMRLGNHMMFLQLQLSTVSPGSKRGLGLSSASPARGKACRQSPPQPLTVPLTVPPRSDLGHVQLHAPQPPKTAINKVCHSNLKMPMTLSPPSVMTPPPSPKSPSGTTPPSIYQYPMTSLQVPSSPSSITAQRDVTLDPSNTPPPSPCYVQKVIPTMPTIQINDKTIPATSVSDNTGHKTDGDITGRLRTCSNVAPVSKDNSCPPEGGVRFLNGSTLAEAKRSLSMKLKEFSEQANTEKPKEATPAGAVIESMQKLGRGVYSGTFSGTLNPALQDREGKPKRSVSTIVHILNDLLGATPPRTGQPGKARNLPHHRGTQHTPEASHIEQENELIRGKVEHLQMMMEERRRRRQARRHMSRAAPYTKHNTSGVGTSGDQLMEAEMTRSQDDDMSSDDSSDSQDQDVGMV